MNNTELVIIIIVLFIMLLPIILLISLFIWVMICNAFSDLINIIRGDDG